MSNESTHLTQFQQKAQIRLQEMEVEWRRTLFERFREICREEMMEVMKTLLSSMHSPEELQQRLAEIQQTQHSAQMELFSTVSQTSEEIKALASKLESHSASPDTQALEELAKEAAAKQESLAKEAISKQEENTRKLQEDVRQSAQFSRVSLMRGVILSAVITLLVCAGAVAALKFLGNSALVSESEVRARDSLSRQKAEAATELKTLQERKETLDRELVELGKRRDALTADIRQNTETQRTAAANVGALQRQITQLQQIQEQFRFKLVKGEEQGVFVEVPPDATPFAYGDKIFIQVK
jgi:chromosome segregation ATPase